ncbi:dihydrolipoyl dehydrogenase [Entomobacter blattae]|uniref:Dihydrolipoyl dehydrogenase n=1 Tax=Entomobacter blattae TaxID=2762277 RepID=A0A7H1NPG8_9PROT|nr:dihydrolipoyl dehydrogenase [Entomobacter blattae]QNT77678.1 Soluble pyridine nucleotide transhydrogenase [Entomobacter blattae]
MVESLEVMDIVVPALGEGIEQAKLGRWVKNSGDAVKVGELVAELETDKVTVEIVALHSGTLGEIVAQEGAFVKEGQVLAKLDVKDSAENEPAQFHSPDIADQAQAPATIQSSSEQTSSEAAPFVDHTGASSPADKENIFDLAVIGGGPGGYACAIRAAQLGMKVACIEKRTTLGGTCLNVGCIPSKALLQSSENYHALMHDFAGHGIEADSVKISIEKMQQRKASVVEANVKGVEFLFRKNNVTWIKGEGVIESQGRIRVEDRIIEASKIVIATGSESADLPGIKIDEVDIVTSTGALAFSEVPQRLAVIGGGVIGVELGSVWKRLGAEVTVIEYADHLINGYDGEIVTLFERLMKKQGMALKMSSRVIEIERKDNGLVLQVEHVKKGTYSEVTVDKVLVAVGRKAYTARLGLEKVGVVLDERGRIKTDAHFATSVPGLYAIGDVIAGPMLAHKASEEGVAVAEHLAGKPFHIDYNIIPAVIYTWPEVAFVGKTEEALKAAGQDYKVGKFPFTASGRARALGTTEGMVKILADAKTDQVLGVHILGPTASELIAEVTMAMAFDASSEDIASVCHAHPTLSEAVKEAALAVTGRAIHI